METYRKEFLGNVSHELKTPIFNIQGYIHSLLDGELDDKELTRHFLNKAAKSADRMEHLVNDLLAISELESGSDKLDLETFDVYELIQDIIEALEFKAREKDITLGFKVGCNPPFFVRADKKKIRQVFVNLITNSIKYGKPSTQTLIGLYDMDKNYLIEVSDHGIGIEEEHLSRLFERFYRVDKARARDEGGTGLGLAIVKHIIEAHNQTINVRSTPGVGSTFGVTLSKALDKWSNAVFLRHEKSTVYRSDLIWKRSGSCGKQAAHAQLPRRAFCWCPIFASYGPKSSPRPTCVSPSW